MFHPITGSLCGGEEVSFPCGVTWTGAGTVMEQVSCLQDTHVGGWPFHAHYLLPPSAFHSYCLCQDWCSIRCPVTRG